MTAGDEKAIWFILVIPIIVLIIIRWRQQSHLVRVDPPLRKRGPMVLKIFRIEVIVPLNTKEVLRYFTEPKLLETWICGAWHGVLCEFDADNNRMRIVNGQDHEFVWQFIKSQPTEIQIRQFWANENPTDITISLTSNDNGTRIQVALEGVFDDALEAEYKADWCALAKLGQPLPKDAGPWP